MKNVVVIFGYNNTRILDVKKIRDLARKKFDADILLCKDKISEQDRAITPHTLEISLEFSSKEKINKLLKDIDAFLLKNALLPIACLPFSDKGVPLGSFYAQHRGLVGDSADESFACVDKFQFRELEKNTKVPDWYRKPVFQKIYNFAEARMIMEECAAPVFFKPTSEGNSRGCIRIADVNELLENQKFIEEYFSSGVIAEECIEGCDEYSFDVVAGQYVITEKKTSSGQFRVETQQVVPAPLNPEDYSRLAEAGQLVCEMTGSRGGAAHHELFFNKKTKQVYCVEPNRRPAGSKIWDWIEASATQAQNWNKWLDWSVGKLSVNGFHPLVAEHFVGMRMLTAPKSGSLSSLSKELIDSIWENEHLIAFEMLKNNGELVTALPKDNSDFIGYITCKSKNVSLLYQSLDFLESKIMSSLVIRD